MEINAELIWETLSRYINYLNQVARDGAQIPNTNEYSEWAFTEEQIKILQKAENYTYKYNLEKDINELEYKLEALKKALAEYETFSITA